MNKALAAVFDGTPGRHRLENLDATEPRSGEMLVKVLGATICGSDRHTFEGRRTVPVPTILGHEIVGEIVAMGNESPRRDLAGNELRIGDRVTWAIVANCGGCFFCARDLPQKCERGVKYGHEAIKPDYALSGGFAEYCMLARGSAIMRLPDDLPESVACPANCATSTAAAALAAAKVRPGDTVAVLGAGLIGLTACAMAAQAGAKNIIAVDPAESRRKMAERFGATLIAAPESLSSVVAEVSPRGVDCVLEVSGADAAFIAAFPLLRIGGRMLLVGSVAPSGEVPIVLERIVRRNLTIIGIHNYAPPDLRTAVEFLSAHHGRYPFAELVAAWYPLGDIDAAFAAAADPKNVRIGVDPRRQT